MPKTKKLIYLALTLVFLFLSSPVLTRAACAFHDITGYVWSGNTGWISLNCGSGGGVDYGLDIDFASGNPIEPVTGYAWSSNLGWLDFQPSGPYPSYPGAPTTAATFNRDTFQGATTTAGTITGWAKFPSLGDNGWMLLGPIDSIDANDYGVSINTAKTFSGWSWSAGENLDADPEPEKGDGWVNWDSSTSLGGAGILGYWFETLYGNIYAGGSIAPSGLFVTPASRYTATYLIQADGNINPVSITSAGGQGTPFKEPGAGLSLQIPDQANQYRGSLGPLDITGIVNGYYGQVVNYLKPPSSQKTSNTVGQNLVLDGKVYHYGTDAQGEGVNVKVDKPLTLQKGTGNQNGGGTIVVEGNLSIDANIYYQSGAVANKIENLPSVAWIVKGNITVDPSVTEIAGIFYSEGGGGISTGTSGDSLTDLSLTVRGLMIAKAINLQRLTVNEQSDPAEQIIFDGRALANPPPGMVDIAKGLPSLREIAP